MARIFFDSHGAAHITCDATAAGAGAFGPTGVSRRLTDAELRRMCLGGDGSGRTPWSWAREQGRLRQRLSEHEWDVLGDEPSVICMVSR